MGYEMRLKKQEEILNIEVRQKIIAEILAGENQQRKANCYKRYLCFKDQTSDFVEEQLRKQFDEDTINEMRYCISNISIVRKVIDKLARVYSNGVTRSIDGDEKSTENLNELSKLLNFNTEIKKANKFLKLQKNLAMYVKPCLEIGLDGSEKYTVKVEPMNPYLYDVVEDFYDRTKPLCYVLSDFQYSPHLYVLGDSAFAGRSGSATIKESPLMGNNKDEMIADTPSDAKLGKYIWWSGSYHFTTDEKGNITSQQVENPINMLPIINFALEQDGQFWAIGGDDLIDGAISANSMLSNIKHVSVTQGYGQFFMFGKKLPRNLKVGPTKAILMEYEDGDPKPELGFATANPQIDSMKALVESDVALLLTTNNLSTSAVSASLGSNSDPASGIAMMLDKSESREDVQDQQQIFIDKEPKIWSVINAWLLAYGDNLCEELKGLSLPLDLEENFSIKFNDATVIQSEAEKIANLKARKELGLNTMIELIMMDNPDLSPQEAEERLSKLEEQKEVIEENPEQDEEQDGKEKEIEKEVQIDANPEDDSK